MVLVHLRPGKRNHGRIVRAVPHRGREHPDPAEAARPQRRLGDGAEEQVARDAARQDEVRRRGRHEVRLGAEGEDHFAEDMLEGEFHGLDGEFFAFGDVHDFPFGFVFDLAGWLLALSLLHDLADVAPETCKVELEGFGGHPVGRG